MPMTGCLLFMGILFFYHSRAGGHFNYSAGCIDASQAIFQLRFEDAKSLLNLEGRKDPDNLVPLSLRNTMETLTLFISEDQHLYSFYIKKREEVCERMDESRQKTPFKLLCLAQYHLEWAFVQLKFRDYFQAAKELKKAQSLFLDNQKRYPDFTLNQSGLGITHVLGALIPSEYRWIASVLGFEAGMGQGVRELLSVADYKGTDPLILSYKPQTLFYLAFIQLNFPTEIVTPESLKMRILNLKSQDLNSPVMVYTLASIYFRLGQNAMARELLSGYKTREDVFPFYYLRYLLGIARLNELDIAAAEDFRYYLDHFRGRSYKASAAQRLAWIALISGDSTGYTDLVNELKNSSLKLKEDDNQFRKEFATDGFPNIFLLKARLLCDGGYFSKALHELTGKPLSLYQRSERERIEYHYRMGRIYQGLALDQYALDFFKTTIELGSDSGYYFAASAAYQSGVIYERKGELKLAAAHYNMALTIPSGEYRTAIRVKAKISLDRISGKIKT
jgi:tetratricopeptide (TPR) repeat protein